MTRALGAAVGVLLAAGLVALSALQACVAAAPASQPAGVRLSGFEAGRHFGEQVRVTRFEPDVAIHINAPSPEALRPGRPTRLILYALPNGNTIAESIGRRPGDGVHWRHGIQHTGAQVRQLREVVDDANIIAAWLEADGKSWPAWKARHADYRERIPRMVEHVTRETGMPVDRLELTGHSGGGSFIFGYIDAADRIADRVGRISFLDSNYGYSDESRHGDKLIAWLRSSREHCLSVICYDDRNIRLDGKLVVGPTGGTWRATQRMLDRLKRDIELTEASGDGLIRYRGLDGRIDVILHPNPENRILHTALVGDMNGLIHAMTCGTKWEDRAGRFNGPVAYAKWIAPD